MAFVRSYKSLCGRLSPEHIPSRRGIRGKVRVGPTFGSAEGTCGKATTSRHCTRQQVLPGQLWCTTCFKCWCLCLLWSYKAIQGANGGPTQKECHIKYCLYAKHHFVLKFHILFFRLLKKKNIHLISITTYLSSYLWITIYLQELTATLPLLLLLTSSFSVLAQHSLWCNDYIRRIAIWKYQSRHVSFFFFFQASFLISNCVPSILPTDTPAITGRSYLFIECNQFGDTDAKASG